MPQHTTLKGLIDKIPDAAESIYQRGAVVYKNKINRAKSVAEKNMFIDSLMLMYDMRAQYFGDNVKPGKTAFILDQKAREFLRYKPNDRKGASARHSARQSRRAATAPTPRPWWPISRTSARIIRATDEVMPDEIIAEYDRLTRSSRRTRGRRLQVAVRRGFRPERRGQLRETSKICSAASWRLLPTMRRCWRRP